MELKAASGRWRAGKVSQNPLHGVERSYSIYLWLGRSKPRIHYMELKVVVDPLLDLPSG